MGKKNTILIPLGKLKRVLLIALLVVFGCEDDPEPEDCAGVEGDTVILFTCHPSHAKLLGGNQVELTNK